MTWWLQCPFTRQITRSVFLEGIGKDKSHTQLLEYWISSHYASMTLLTEIFLPLLEYIYLTHHRVIMYLLS